MAGAGVVLFFSGGRRMLRAAVMQAVFPLFAWFSWLAF
jgi:putative membrane protein